MHFFKLIVFTTLLSTLALALPLPVVKKDSGPVQSAGDGIFQFRSPAQPGLRKKLSRGLRSVLGIQRPVAHLIEGEEDLGSESQKRGQIISPIPFTSTSPTPTIRGKSRRNTI